MGPAVQNTHLLDITEVQPFSPEDPRDAQCFEEVARVLASYGFSDRFGVCLLHKHFDVMSDERLVESCDFTNRTLTTAPYKREDLPPGGRLMETSWSVKLGHRGVPEVSCETYCREDSDGHDLRHKKDR